MRKRTAISALAGLAAALSLSAVRRNPAPVDVPLAWPASGSKHRIEYLQSISSPEDLAIRRGWLSRFANLVLGPSEKPRRMFRPFTMASDPQGRLLIADPGIPGVHLLDVSKNQHKLLLGPGRRRLQSPIGLDADASGNIYVTDSALGMIFVFNRDGRFERFIGEASKGEGIYKRPTGLAIDRASGSIYLTDTLRHKVFVLDPAGKKVAEWGRRGEAGGEFNFPTAVALAPGRVFVLDAMNFRVQAFDTSGHHLASFGRPVNEPGGLFRPKGLAVDSAAGLVYVVDAMFEVVQAFTFEGKLVLAFGQGGSRPGEFRLPAGISVLNDRVLVADSLNRRIQVFRTVSQVSGGPLPSSRGGTKIGERVFSQEPVNGGFR